MTSRPRDIADEETIVRGICSPYHVNKKGALKHNAYLPPDGTDEVSVMRADWIGADLCKQHARDLENLAERKVYKGLAVLSARQIRNKGATLIDTRETFEGHADIRHGITPSKNNPLPPDQLLILHDRTKSFAALANYYPDPEPTSVTWTGPALRYKRKD
jgi:hypothetical protein